MRARTNRAKRSGARALGPLVGLATCVGWLAVSALPAAAQTRDRERAPKRAEVRVQRPAPRAQVERHAPEAWGRARAVARPHASARARGPVIARLELRGRDVPRADVRRGRGAAETRERGTDAGRSARAVRVRDVGVRLRDVPAAELRRAKVRRAEARPGGVPRAEPRWELRDATLWTAWPRSAEPAGPTGRRADEGRARFDDRRWAYGGYGPVWHDPYGHRWTWHWWYDPYWHGHHHVFVFRRGHGHRHHPHHHGFGHHHGIHLHHGFFHDFWFHHHGHLHFVIVVVASPRVAYVPVYEPPVGWVVETRELPVLVQAGVPGAVYGSGSCARLEIVTREGEVWSFAVDPADFGAENVGELQDAIEEALAARGELDVEDLSGVRHVIPRESIREIRGGPCRVD